MNLAFLRRPISCLRRCWGQASHRNGRCTHEALPVSLRRHRLSVNYCSSAMHEASVMPWAICNYGYRILPLPILISPVWLDDETQRSVSEQDLQCKRVGAATRLMAECARAQSWHPADACAVLRSPAVTRAKVAKRDPIQRSKNNRGQAPPKQKKAAPADFHCHRGVRV